MKLFTAKKDMKRSWPAHYLYLVAVSDAAGGDEQRVLDNIVRFASPELSTILMEKYQTHRLDYLVHAEELAHFAQTIEMESRSGCALGREVVAHVEKSMFRMETRTCYVCGKSGHVMAGCRSKKTDHTNGGCRAKGGGNIVLAIGEGTSIKSSRHAKSDEKLTIGEDTDRDGEGWILNSESSRHLVNDLSLLQDAKMCEHECHLADGEPVKLLRVGNVVLTVVSGGNQRDVTLSEVYLAPGLSRNIIFIRQARAEGTWTCVCWHEARSNQAQRW